MKQNYKRLIGIGIIVTLTMAMLCSCGTEKKEMELRYVVNQSDQAQENKYYSNGSGELLFAQDDPLNDYGLSENTKYVTYTEPESYVQFTVVNNKDEALENPIVQFSFDNVIMWKDQGNENEGLVYTNNIAGIDGYEGLDWEPGATIRPGEEVTFKVYFSEAAITADKASVTVTIGADNSDMKNFTIPIKLHDVGGSADDSSQDGSTAQESNQIEEKYADARSWPIDFYYTVTSSAADDSEEFGGTYNPYFKATLNQIFKAMGFDSVKYNPQPDEILAYLYVKGVENQYATVVLDPSYNNYDLWMSYDEGWLIFETLSIPGGASEGNEDGFGSLETALLNKNAVWKEIFDDGHYRGDGASLALMMAKFLGQNSVTYEGITFSAPFEYHFLSCTDEDLAVDKGYASSEDLKLWAKYEKKYNRPITAVAPKQLSDDYTEWYDAPDDL